LSNLNQPKKKQQPERLNNILQKPINFIICEEGFIVMRKRLSGDPNFLKKVIQLNKKALAQEQVVSLDAYRNIARPNSSKTILLVDDDPIALSAMKKIFEVEQYRVFIAKDAMEVSKILEDSSLDIVLLNTQLPWVDGYELCSLLKSSPALKNLPIALISANNTEEDIRKGYESGCDEYIIKPFSIDELQQTVEKLLVRAF
jgi:CheY-like chemotaxis protein